MMHSNKSQVHNQITISGHNLHKMWDLFGEGTHKYQYPLRDQLSKIKHEIRHHIATFTMERPPFGKLTKDPEPPFTTCSWDPLGSTTSAGCPLREAFATASSAFHGGQRFDSPCPLQVFLKEYF